MLVKATLCAQLKRARVRLLHTVCAPALDRAEGVTKRDLEEQFRFVALSRIIDVGNLIQPALQMTDRFVVR